MATMQGSCDRCKYWEHKHCKRMPPVRDADGYVRWPETKMWDTCGEFTSKDK